MAQTTPANGNGVTKVEKDAVITVYGEDHFGSKREFLAEVLKNFGVDPNKRERTETTDYTLRIGDYAKTLFGHQYEEIQEAMEEGFDLGDVEIEVDKKVSMDYANSPTTLVKSYIVKDLCKSLPDDLGFGIKKPGWSSWLWYNDDETNKVRVQGGSVERRRVLKHQSVRSADDRHETPEDEEGPFSFEVTVSIVAPSDEAMESLSETVVKGAYDYMSTLPGVAKCRLTDCKTRTEKEGDCYGI